MNTLLTSAEVLELVNIEYSSLGNAHKCKLLRRGFNDNYLVGIGNEWYVFRVYFNHKYYIESPDAFQFELDLIAHLYDLGVPVAPPKPRNNNELLGFTKTPLGDRAFAMFAYAVGDVLPMRLFNSEKAFYVGKTTAELHIAANSFQSEHRRYHLDRKYLVDEPLKIIAQQKDPATRVVSESRAKRLEEFAASMEPIEELLETVAALELSGDEFGIIHSDLHSGNMHFNGDQLTLFDFDHCAYGWRAYELGITEFIPKPLKIAFLKGYESVRPLSDGERECIPVFAKLRELWDVGDSIAIERVQAETADE